MAAIIGNRNISLGVMGGTLITAACYGGGNVFGCSPYDAATTAYLKATYPSYWAQIRDYGFANPQLVPWINEDNDLIVSLVEVGKVRGLKGDGVAYIDSGVIANTPRLCVDCIADVIGFTRYANTLFGAEDTLNNGWDCYSIVYHSIGGIGLRVGRIGNADIASGVSNNTKNVKFESITTDTTFELIVNGISKGVKNKGSVVSKPIYLYRMNCAGADGSVGTPSAFKYIRFYADEVDIKHFAPFVLGTPRTAEQCYPQKACASGTCGMLDLLTGTFYPNANTSGAFTIEITE